MFGNIAKSVQAIGGGLAETGKGIVTGDPVRAAQGYGDVIMATPAGQLADPLAKIDPWEQIRFKKTVDPATGKRQLEGGLGIPESIAPVAEGLASIDPTTGLPPIDLSGVLTGGGQSQFAAQTADLFQQPSPFDVQTLTPLQLQAAQVGAVEDIGIGGPSQFAGGQAELIAALQGQAAGTAGPSLAELQMQAERDRALQQQAALASSIGGRALPAAQRQLAQQAALSGQQQAQQAAILRAQEQQAAQQQLAQLLGTARSQDIQREGLGLTAAQANQQAALETALAQSQLEQQAAIERARQGLQAQEQQAQLGLRAQESQADLALRGQMGQADLAKAQLAEESARERELIRAETQRQMTEQERKDRLLGSVISGAAQIGAGAIA